MKAIVFTMVTIACVFRTQPQSMRIPTYCHPFTYPFTQCYVNHIDEYFYRWMGPNVTHLRVLFLGQHVELINQTFATAPNLKVLAVVYTHYMRITQDAFAGILDLRALSIYPTDGVQKPILKFDKDWIKPLSAIQIINLKRNQIDMFEAGQFCKQNSLKSLRLSYNSLKDLEDFGVTCGNNNSQFCQSCLPNLKYLDISNNRVSTFNLSFLKKLPKLEQLEMGYLSLQQISWVDAIITSNLQHFDLSQNKITSFAVFNQVKYNVSELVSLKLQRNQLEHISPNFFKYTKNLEILYLNENILNLETLIRAGLAFLTRLRVLDLSFNYINSLQYDMLHRMTELVSFSCSRCKLKNIQDGTFNNLSKLRALILNANQLQVITGTFTHLTTLRILDISRNKLIDFILSDEIPSLIELYIAGNELNHIPDFSLSRMYLYTLDLSRNNISDINFDKFSNPKQLVSLNLSYCNIETLPSFFGSFMLSLKILDLRANLITYVHAGTFMGLNSIEEINLSQNNIQDFWDSTFQLTNAEVLNLAYNNLTSLEQTTMKLKTPRAGLQAILHGNPWNCDCGMWWLVNINNKRNFPLVPNIDGLICQYPQDKRNVRFTKFTPDDLTCHYRTTCDDITCHCCSKGKQCHCHLFCYDECDCFVSHNLKVNFMNCTARNITSLAYDQLPLVVNTIYLDGNNLIHVTQSQLHFSSVEKLFLNKSNVSYIEPWAFTQLKKIKEIHLQNNQIKEVDDLKFGNLTALEGLYLQNNEINWISPGSLSQLTSLNLLFLHNNNLSFLDVSMFNKMPSLASISLHDNPWQCDCTFGQEFQKWLTINSERISNTKRIICRNRLPENTTIMDIDFSYCYRPKVIAGLVSLTAVFAVISTITIICYKNRLLLMVWAYNRYGVRFHHEEEDNDDKPFDVFIANTPADEQFVVRELLPRLENPEGMNYKVLIECRDWPGGVFITDTILASIERSKRTILLVSDNYFKAHWCQYEFQAAHYQVLKDKQIRLIIVLTSKALQNQMEADMKLYLKTGTYLTWGEKYFWEKLKYYLPDNPRGDGLFLPLIVNVGNPAPDGDEIE